MHNFLIGEYIKNLELKDILDYCQKEKIEISNNDAIILLSYAKKYYKEFINGNPDKIIKEIKEKINPDTFKEAYKRYIEAKIKYL